LVLDLSLLDLRSVFGGDLAGEAIVHVSSPEAMAFQRPPELAACGTLWLPGVETAEALAQAIIDAHDHVRTRLDDDQQTLKRLGMKPKLVPPEPRARAKASVAGRSVQVAIDGNGDLVVEAVDGARVPVEEARALETPDDADGGEALRRLQQVVEKLEQRGVVAPSESFDVDVDVDIDGDDDEAADEDGGTPSAAVAAPADGDDDGDDAWSDDAAATLGGAKPTNATQHLSDEQMAELHAALGEADEEEDSAEQEELIDASDEAEPVQPKISEDSEPTLSVTAVPESQRSQRAASAPAANDSAFDDDEPKTITLQAPRKPSSLIDALGNESAAAADPVRETSSRTAVVRNEVVDSEAESQADDSEAATLAVDRASLRPPIAGPASSPRVDAPASSSAASKRAVDDDDDDAYNEPTAALGEPRTEPRGDQLREAARRAGLSIATAPNLDVRATVGPFAQQQHQHQQRGARPPQKDELDVAQFPALSESADEHSHDPSPTSVNTPDLQLGAASQLSAV
ncbi:MAG TPA: hypothetical protein VGO62_22175, partial [Myxococcota bacterium]